MLGPSSFSKSVAAARGMMPVRMIRLYLSVCQRSPGRTHNVGIALLARARGAHGVGLAGARLSVGQNGDVVALHERVDAINDVVVDTFLVDVLAEDAVENEHLPPPGPVDGEARGRRYVACWRAESLGDEFEARVAWLERWAHADSWRGLRLEHGMVGTARGTATYQL